MPKWDPREAISCYDELQGLDHEYDRLKSEFSAACERGSGFPHDLSEQLQALRLKMLELEKQELDRLVARRREAAPA